MDSHKNSELSDIVMVILYVNDEAMTKISQSFDFGMITAEWTSFNSNKEGGLLTPGSTITLTTGMAADLKSKA